MMSRLSVNESKSKSETALFVKGWQSTTSKGSVILLFFDTLEKNGV